MTSHHRCYFCQDILYDIKKDFCRKCFDERDQDVCEIIHQNGNMVINKGNIQQLRSFLDQYDITVRLDLHGVLNTIPKETIFDHPDKICCISFVAPTTRTRSNARKEIGCRLGHQIKYGVLVFARGKMDFHEIGGKAWLNSLIPSGNNKALFVDDSKDHYESTKSLKLPWLDTHLYLKHNNLYKLINKYIK